MLQYPVNIYPDNSTFDATLNDDSNQIRFTFNGDIFSGALYKVFNYDTGEFVKDGIIELYQDHSPQGYNGDDIVSSTGVFGYAGNSPLSNGTNYVVQLQLVQFTQDGSQPLYDMFALRGNVQEDYDSSTDYVTIKAGISNIYEWDTYTPSSIGARYPSTAWGELAGGMQIVINGEKRKILGYNYVNGHVMIDTPFTTQITAGTKYQIYSNYIITKPCYFQCRTTSLVDLNIAITDDGTRGDQGIGFNVTGTYNQNEGSLINYYRLKLQWSWDATNPNLWKTIDETDKIYSQNISFKFYDDFVLRYKAIINNEVVDVTAEQMGDIYYRAVAEIVTVDGVTITEISDYVVDEKTAITPTPSTPPQITVTERDSDIPDVDYPKSIDEEIQIKLHNLKHSVYIEGGGRSSTPNHTKYTYYRHNLNTGELRLLEGVYDVTVPTKGSFRYYEILRHADTTNNLTERYYEEIVHTDINIDMKGASITELILREDEYQWGTKPRYKVGEQWKFVGEISDTTITQNTDKFSHVGYGTYPKITSTKTCYLSGSMSAMQGYVDCTTKKYKDDIDLVRAWRMFITKNTMYMLKTQKGDVLVVGVVDNPSTTYSDSIKELPTTFTFNWIELCDIDDIKVDYIIELDPNDVY